MTTKHLPTTIDDVLVTLDGIIAETVAENNFLGIFAYVYRRTTAQVKAAILRGDFEDNERMERMDVAFANLYIAAYRKFQLEEKISKSWRVAFEAKDEPITLIQHLMLGMNAHINFDLGIAAATVAPGAQIHAIENDFMKVNDILASLTNEMQYKMGKVSFFMFLLDWIGKRRDEEIINFNMIKARNQAWKFALQLAQITDTAERQLHTSQKDEIISSLGSLLRRPPTRLLRSVLQFINYFELKEVRQIIHQLQAQDA